MEDNKVPTHDNTNVFTNSDIYKNFKVQPLSEDFNDPYKGGRKTHRRRRHRHRRRHPSKKNNTKKRVGDKTKKRKRNNRKSRH